MANSFVVEVAGCYLNLDCCRHGWNSPDIAEKLSISHFSRFSVHS